MRVSMTMAGAALAVGLAVQAQAQDPNYARNLAANCTACHGTEGRSVGGVPPSLAGLDRDYLLQQLNEFKTGKRPGTIMPQQAKGYTDEQLGLIAAYFAGLKGGQGAAAPAARGSGY